MSFPVAPQLYVGRYPENVVLVPVAEGEKVTPGLDRLCRSLLHRHQLRYMHHHRDIQRMELARLMLSSPYRPTSPEHLCPAGRFVLILSSVGLSILYEQVWCSWASL